MKKILVLMLCLAALATAGCGKKEVKEENSPAPTQKVEVVENGAIGAVEENGKVKINMPAVVFGEDVEKTANEVKEKRGFEDIIIESDGSVTFVMTKQQQKKWVLDTAENTKTVADEFVKSYHSLKEVSFNEDFTEAKIVTDKALYNSTMDKAAAEGVANMLFNCQSLNGVKAEDLKALVSFVDEATGEVIETAEILGNK